MTLDNQTITFKQKTMQNPNKPTKETSPLISRAIFAAAKDWQKLDKLMAEPYVPSKEFIEQLKKTEE